MCIFCDDLHLIEVCTPIDLIEKILNIMCFQGDCGFLKEMPVSFITDFGQFLGVFLYLGDSGNIPSISAEA